MVQRRRSRLPFGTRVRLLKHFVGGTPARTAAGLVGVNRHTATLFFHKLREIIAARIAEDAPLDGEIELDESCFGGVSAKERKAVGLAARSSSSACSSAVGRSTP